MKMEEREEAEFIQQLITGEEKRRLRKQKRKRNQLIARISVIVFLALFVFLVITGVSFGGKAKDKGIAAGDAKEQQEASITEIANSSLELEAENDPDESKESKLSAASGEVLEEETESREYQKQDQALEQAVEAVIAKMTLEEKVAGVFLVCPEAITGVETARQAGEGTRKALEQYPVGGLVYYGRNIKSSEQIKDMIAGSVSYAKYPLFISVDEEGGEVARFANGLKLNNPGHMADVGATKDPAKAREAMEKIGLYLKEYGVNLNFAPVADILNEEGKGILTKRSFGREPGLVADMVVAGIQGLNQQGVTACIKHFPGIGEALEDTHEKMSVINRTKEELLTKELVPFKAAIEAGADMIMIAHTSYPEIIGDNTPASLSKEIITELLREELGYNGVVITDALNMAAITEYYGADEAAVKALKAGSDMIFMPEDFELAYQGVMDAVREGTISEERIEDGLKRIYRIKFRDLEEGKILSLTEKKQ